MRIISAVQSAISFGVGAFITFSQSHSASVGLLALGLFGIGYGVLNITSSLIWGKGLVAIEAVPLTVVAIIIGGLSLAIRFSGQNVAAANQLADFILLVTAWGIIVGAFQVYLARRAGFKTSAGRDLVISAGLSIAYGVLFLTVPLNSVWAVGLFSSYLLISAVHLGIIAASPVSSPVKAAKS